LSFGLREIENGERWQNRQKELLNERGTGRKNRNTQKERETERKGKEDK
jgi:hypothetical protein